MVNTIVLSLLLTHYSLAEQHKIMKGTYIDAFSHFYILLENMSYSLERHYKEMTGNLTCV